MSVLVGEPTAVSVSYCDLENNPCIVAGKPLFVSILLLTVMVAGFLLAPPASMGTVPGHTHGHVSAALAEPYSGGVVPNQCDGNFTCCGVCVSAMGATGTELFPRPNNARYLVPFSIFIRGIDPVRLKKPPRNGTMFG
jgi:hypothetical protein